MLKSCPHQRRFPTCLIQHWKGTPSGVAVIPCRSWRPPETTPKNPTLGETSSLCSSFTIATSPSQTPNCPFLHLRHHLHLWALPGSWDEKNRHTQKHMHEMLQRNSANSTVPSRALPQARSSRNPQPWLCLRCCLF